MINPILIILSLFLIEIIAIFYFFRYEILSFFNPNGYYRSEIISNGVKYNNWNKYQDGNLHKDSGFNYEMIPELSIRTGVVNCWVWIQGNKKPIDFRDEEGSKVVISKSMSKIDVMKLFEEDLSFGQQMIDQIIKALPVIIIGAFVVYMFLNGKNP